MARTKKLIIAIVRTLFSKHIQRKTNLSKIQSRELAICVLTLLHQINGFHFRRNRIFLRLMLNEINWRDFAFTEQQFLNAMQTATTAKNYCEPIGMWFTIDSEKNYVNAPKIQNTDRITYYASGREPFLAVINQIRTEHKTVLVPAFTCFTVSQPFLEKGWEIVYYKVTKDLRISTQEVEALYKEHKPAIAIFMEHSGMDLTDDELQTIGKLKQAGCVTIVDRTQNIYSESRNKEIDFYCGSLRKWFCCPDGGYLERNGDIPLPPAPSASEYNDVYTTVSAAMMFANGLLRKSKINEYWTISRFFQRLSAHYICSQPVRTRNMSAYSKAVYFQERSKDKEYIARRKANFEYIFNRISGFSTISPVTTDFSRYNSVPFYFQIYADNRKRLSNYLWKKHIIAWNHVPRTDSSEVFDSQTEYMFQHILALPCDQRYTEEDMKILCDALKEYEMQYRTDPIVGE